MGCETQDGTPITTWWLAGLNMEDEPLMVKHPPSYGGFGGYKYDDDI